MSAHLFRTRVVELAGVLLGVLAGAPSALASSPVTCGATLLRDTRLREDLQDCPGDGLVLGADDITLDCDGHAIAGIGGANGVRVDGRASVSVKNCRILGFSRAIGLVETTGSTVERNIVTCAGSATGILVQDGIHDRIVDNDIGYCETGINVAASSVIDVDDNIVVGSHTGIVLQAAVYGARVRHNQVYDSGTALGFGAHVLGSTIEDNVVDRAWTGFFSNGDVSGNRIDDNEVRYSQSGFSLYYSPRNVLDGNLAMHNVGTGIMFFQGSSWNLIEDNETDDNGMYGVGFHSMANGNVLEDSSGCGNGDFDAYQPTGAGNLMLGDGFCTTSGF